MSDPAPLTIAAVACALAAYTFFAVQSVVLAFIDARTRRLPDRWVLPGYPVAAVLLSAAALLGGEPARLVPTAGGLLVLLVLYLLVRTFRPDAMGGGDVKLAGVIGAFLGFLGWDAVLLGGIAGFILGGLYAFVLLLTGRAGARTRIAFGPFMLGGAWLAIVAAALPALM